VEKRIHQAQRIGEYIVLKSVGALFVGKGVEVLQVKQEKVTERHLTKTPPLASTR
jgi:hypothetical protein